MMMRGVTCSSSSSADENDDQGVLLVVVRSRNNNEKNKNKCCWYSSVVGLLVGLILVLSITYQQLRSIAVGITLEGYSNSWEHHQQQQRHQRRRRLLLEKTSGNNDEHQQSEPPPPPPPPPPPGGVGKGKGGKKKILYTITSLAEYNTGTRATIKGSDRLQETMIPVMSESVHSMLSLGYEVDVFIVSHYKLRPERLQLIKDGLPSDGSVGLEYWDDAMPLGYNVEHYKEGDGTSKIGERMLSLARQHRFVIRDHFMEYDIFVNFEDDMLMKGEQIRHYIEVVEELDRLKTIAPENLPGIDPNDGNYYGKTFHGQMTKGQLSRMIPGFIRVEVLLEPDNNSKNFHTKESTIPIDLVFDDDKDTGGGKKNHTVDPIPCCHVAKERSSSKRPSNPKSDQLMFWETDILPLGVRKMPEQQEQQQQSSTTTKGTLKLDWVALLRGPTYNKDTEPNTIIGDYWSGTDGYFGKGKKRPGGNARNMINNMGGWMATREQIWEWHHKICPGGFLPPYEAPHFRFDGLDLRDVEWWSGGLHLVTARHACNLQRIMVLDPEKFHYHLLYHTANNKQNSLPASRFTRANDLLGQLNTVRKNAEKAIAKSNGK